eukprot:m.1559437 g.1559437  ORF g.1559437 m.1559437 type:complete len:2778 (+) comp25276_c0_seq3:118-8451(+)
MDSAPCLEGADTENDANRSAMSAPSPESDKHSVNVSQLCDELARDATEDDEIVYENVSKTVFVIGKTGAGKSTFISFMLKLIFEFVNKPSSDLSPDDIAMLQSSGCEIEMEQVLTLKNSTPKSPRIGDGHRSVTDKCTAYRKSSESSIIFVDTPGFNDTKGVHVDTVHSLRMARCIRQNENIVVALVIPVQEIVSYKDRTHLKSNESFLLGISSFMKDNPENFPSLRLFLNKFSTPDQPKKELGAAFLALRAVLNALDSGDSDMNPKIKPVVEHMAEQISASLRQETPGELVIVPAGRTLPEERVVDSNRGLAWKALERTPPVSSINVGLALDPGAIAAIESACVRFHAAIQSMLQSDSGADSSGICEHLGDMRLLRMYAPEIVQVHDQYRNSVNAIADFIESNFMHAQTSLQQREYKSAADLLATAGSLHALKRFSKGHPDGRLQRISRVWQEIQSIINKDAAALYADIVSRGVSYSDMCARLAWLHDISTRLKGFLLPDNASCYDNAITHLRKVIHQAFEHAKELVEQQRFRGDDLRVAMDTLAAVQCFSPRFIDEAGRLGQVKRALADIFSTCVNDFTAHSSSMAVLVNAQTYGPTQRALTIIDDVHTGLSAHLAVGTLALGNVCQQKYEKLRDDAMQFFRHALKEASTVSRNLVESADVDLWDNAALAMAHVHLVCKLRLRDEMSSKMLQEAKNTLFSDINAMCTHTEEIFAIEQGNDLNIALAAHLTTQLVAARQALLNLVHPNVQKDLHTATTTIDAALDSTASSVLHLVTTVTKNATAHLKTAELRQLMEPMDVLESLCANGLVQHASHAHIASNESGVQARILQLLQALADHVRTTCENSDTSANELSRLDTLPDTHIQLLASHFEALQQCHILMTHLASTATALAEVTDSSTDDTNAVSAQDSQNCAKPPPYVQNITECQSVDQCTDSIDAAQLQSPDLKGAAARQTNVFLLNDHGVCASHDRLCQAILAYANRCLDRCKVALSNNDVGDVQWLLSTLQRCSCAFDAYFTHETAILKILHEAQQTVRAALEDALQAAKSGIAEDDLGIAEKNIHRLHVMEPLTGLFTEFNMANAVQQVAHEYSTKQCNFTSNVRDAFNSHRFDEVAKLLQGGKDVSGPDGSQCASCLAEISNLIHARVKGAQNAIDLATHADESVLPRGYVCVAEVLQWLESATPLAAVIPTYERDVRSLHEHISTFLQRTYQRGISDVRCFNFLSGLNARSVLNEHLRLRILPDEAKALLEQMNRALQTVVEKLPEELDLLIRSDSGSFQIQMADNLDQFFDGMYVVSQVRPQTKITRAISTEFQNLRNRLYQILRGYCTDAKEAYLNFHLKDGIASFNRLKALMTSRTCQNLLHDNEDNGVPYLRELQWDTIDRMFEPSRIKGGNVDDRKENMHELRSLLPDQYRRHVTHFLEAHVATPTRAIMEKLQSQTYTTNEVKRTIQMLQVLPIYANVFESHADVICETLLEVDEAFVEKVEQAKLEAHVMLRGSNVDGAARLVAPFLKLVPTALACAKSLHQPAATDWRKRFISAQSPELASEIEDFLRERLRTNDDGSSIERDWDRLIQNATLERVTETHVVELSTYVNMLRTEQDLLLRMTQLSSHVTYANALRILTQKFGALALVEAASCALEKEDLSPLADLLQAITFLKLMDDPTLTEIATDGKQKVHVLITERISALEDESSAQFARAMSNTISSECKDICIAKVNSLMEKRDKIAAACSLDRAGSKATGKIKAATAAMKERALKYVSEPASAADDGFHTRVADFLVMLYEAPAAMSNEDVKAHAHECSREILTAFKRQPGSSISRLDEQLQQHELGHEIVDSHDIFSRTKMEKMNKAMATLSDDGAIQKITKMNHLEKEDEDVLRKCWKTYREEFLAAMMKRHREGHAGLAKDAIADFRASRRQPRDKIVQLVAKACAVWSLEKSPRGDGGEVTVFLQPHAAQILAIFRLLELDCTTPTSLFSTLVKKLIGSGTGKPPNHLAQVKTGQGKSVILGVTALVLAVMGYTVDCACYSKYLSERDMEDFEPIFTFFKVRDQIRYGTFQYLAARLLNSRGDVRQLTQQLCGVGHRLPTSTGRRKKHKNNRVLLIDEVDVFFSAAFYGNTYDPIALIRGPQVNALMHMIWNDRAATPSDILSKVRASDEYKSILDGIGADPRRQQIIRDQVEHSVRDLQDFLAHPQPVDRVEQQYKVVDGKICYKTIDTVSSDIDFGYRTLWAYFKEHTDNPEAVSQDSVQDHIALQVACGQFSYAEAPKEYGVILGVTGTLEQSLSLPHQRKVLEKEYNITRQTLMPSMFGDSKLNFKERDHVFVEKDTDTYYRKIQEEAQQNSALGRPVLIYFESETALREWRDSGYGQGCFTEGVVASITAATPNIDHYIQRASRAKMVTLLSREHGRGLDFKNTSDQVDVLKGIHIIQTFLSEEPSEEVQIQGRTARMGKNGTYVLVLHLAHLDKFAVTEEDINDLSRGGDTTIYSHLCAKRQRRLEENAKTREEAAAAALVLHRQSKLYQKNLVGAEPSNFTDNELVAPCFTYLQSLNGVARKCRLVCLSDATGSMDALWSAARGQFTEMLRRIAEIAGSTSQIEIQWVAYRDYDCEGRPQAPLIESSGWTTDASALVRFVGKILCRGGRDYEEAIEAALAFVNDLDNTPSRVLLFGDAPPHPETVGQHLEYHNRTMTTDYVEECKKLNAKSTPVPVYPFYMHEEARASFQHIAELTGGEAQSLDRSRLESGDAKQLLDAVCLQALQEIGGEAMTRSYKAKYRE